MTLNFEQDRAVRYIEGPQLITAGPGAGKTRVLIYKVKYLIEEEDVDPGSIILTTFTVKAAEELRNKINKIVEGQDISSMFIGTIHSFCDDIIKKFGGIDSNPVEYSIMDDVERFILIKSNWSKFGIENDEIKLLKHHRDTGEKISDLLRFYDEITENLMDTRELKQYMNDNINKVEGYYKHCKDKKKLKEILEKLIDSYDIYTELLMNNKLLDFALLEKNAYLLLKQNEILKNVTDNIEYVLIDEFQDINPLQWMIFHLITAGRVNVSVVGDKNQSIYGFRGANPNIFDRFLTEFPDAKPMELNTNYRSKVEIIDLSSKFLDDRDTIDIVPHRDERTKIYSIEGERESHAARAILELIDELYNDGKIRSYGDVALLFRSVRNHGRIFREILKKEFPHIPYNISGGTSFLENPEVIDLIYLLSYIFGEEKSDIVKKITGYESFNDLEGSKLMKISPETWNILRENPEMDLPSIKDREILKAKQISERDADILVRLNLQREKNQHNSNMTILDVFYEILGILSLEEPEELQTRTADLGVILHLAGFSDIAHKYGNYYSSTNLRSLLYLLRDLPDNYSVGSSSDDYFIDNPEELKLMTVHQAKGLEFPIVVIPSLVNRRFPSTRYSRPLFQFPRDSFLYEPYNPDKEEENLFYVATTRAQDSLILSRFKHHEKSGNNVRASEFYERTRHYLCHISDYEDYEVSIPERGKDKETYQVVDYTSISTYVDCPERFKIRYVFGFMAEELFTQRMGCIYHNAIGKINARLKEHKNITADNFKEILGESWIRLKKEETADNIMKLKVLKDIKRYYHNMKNEVGEIESIEEKLGINFDTVRVRGRLDLLYKDKDGNTVLMDFKSRKMKEIEKTHTDLQLRMYARALEKAGRRIDKLIAYPIQEENLKIEEGELTFSETDRREVNELVSGFVDNVKKGCFDGVPSQTRFCGSCPYRTICRKFDK